VSAGRSPGLVAVVLALAVIAGACSSGVSVSDTATPTKKIKQLPGDLVPHEILGLAVAREDMTATLKGARRAYTDAVGLYSFRKDDLLEATLQVTKFNDKAKWTSRSFRSQVISQIGGSVPRQVRVGDDTVYLTRGTKQSLSIWFRGQHLLVLAVREDYLGPRTLLREALKVKP
jgi:hypothetical protein